MPSTASSPSPPSSLLSNSMKFPVSPSRLSRCRSVPSVYVLGSHTDRFPELNIAMAVLCVIFFQLANGMGGRPESANGQAMPNIGKLRKRPDAFRKWRMVQAAVPICEKVDYTSHSQPTLVRFATFTLSFHCHAPPSVILALFPAHGFAGLLFWKNWGCAPTVGCTLRMDTRTSCWPNCTTLPDGLHCEYMRRCTHITSLLFVDWMKSMFVSSLIANPYYGGGIR